MKEEQEKKESMQEEKRRGAMRIFGALSAVDEELLERSNGKNHVIPFRRYTKAAAACLCFAVLGVAAWAGYQGVSVKKAMFDNCAPARALQEEMAKDTYAPEEQQSDTESIKEAVTALSETQLRATEELGAFIPTSVPSGYVFESGYRSKDAETDETEGLRLLWTRGMDDISISVWKYEENVGVESRLADVSRPETYDVRLYEIPYADTVPEEYRIVFDNPIFKAEDFNRDIVEARMKSVSDKGDTDTPRGNFTVLFGDAGVLVEFSGRGDADSIWNMFASLIR